MVYQEEDVRGLRPLFKTAPEIGPGKACAFHTGSGGCTAVEKFGEPGKNREEACCANRIERNGNPGAHYTGVRAKLPVFSKMSRLRLRRAALQDRDEVEADEVDDALPLGADALALELIAQHARRGQLGGGFVLSRAHR